MIFLNELEILSEQVNGLNFIIDPRLELLAAIQINAEYPFLTPFTFGYLNQMKDYFSKYQEHIAVKIFKQMFNKGFSYHIPVQFMLNINNDLDDETGPLITTEEYKLWNDAVEDYYLTTNFKDFYQSNKHFYKNLISELIEQLKVNQLIKHMEMFFGYKQNSYNIILSPVSINGGYGITNKIKDDYIDCYAVCGALGVDNDYPIFNISAVFGEYKCDYIFTMLIWHEFGHTYVNPLTSKYRI